MVANAQVIEGGGISEILSESLRDKNQESVRSERQVMYALYAGSWLLNMVLAAFYVSIFDQPDRALIATFVVAVAAVLAALPLRDSRHSRYLYLPGLWLLAGVTFFGAVHYNQPVIAMFLLLPGFFLAVFYWYDRWLTAAHLLVLTALNFAAPLLTDIAEPLRLALMMAPTFASLVVALGYLGAHANRLNVERSRFDSTISSLLVALHERDGDSTAGATNVEDLALGVAQNMGLGGDELRLVLDAARLHDVGKIGIPSELLDKPAALTSDEWLVMRTHPEIGERIVATVPGFDDVAIVIRHTHERWDGNGYPDRFGGLEIPLASRIIFACDAYAAMTASRPFRPALSHEDACRELRRGAGTQFDPSVVDSLLEVFGLEELAGDDHSPGGEVIPLRRAAVA